MLIYILGGRLILTQFLGKVTFDGATRPEGALYLHGFGNDRATALITYVNGRAAA